MQIHLSPALYAVREQRILKLINEQQKDSKLGKGLTPNQFLILMVSNGFLHRQFYA